MQQPDWSQFECDYEKNLYRAINYFRFAPNKFVEIVKELKKDFPEFKKDGDLCTNIMNQLHQLPSSRQVFFQNEANEACR